MKRTYGLIGKKLVHSFSKKYFTTKFQQEQITGCQYELFEIPSITEFPRLLQQHPTLHGLNVTIPYKVEVMQFLDGLDDRANRIGAVNVIKFRRDGKKVGYNSDCIGFSKSLTNFIPNTNLQALILGTGGASKAIKVALEDLSIPYQFVSRRASADTITYQDIDASVMNEYQLIINTTPLGTYPQEDTFPSLPYQALGDAHYLYDLVYNPATTAFIQKGLDVGAKAKNGLEMLELQAEASWDIWNQENH